jgi:hypothetical protein
MCCVVSNHVSFNPKFLLFVQKLEALAKPGHARSMAKLRQHHKAGKVGSRSSMSLLSDVSEEDSAPQEDEEGVEGEWPPVASIKRFKTVDEVREAAAKLEDMKIDVGCTSGTARLNINSYYFEIPKVFNVPVLYCR